MDSGIQSYRVQESHELARSGYLDFLQEAPNQVLKTMGTMCRLCRAFEVLSDSDRDLTQFVKQ
jgi:hypothetical protein